MDAVLTELLASLDGLNVAYLASAGDAGCDFLNIRPYMQPLSRIASISSEAVSLSLKDLTVTRTGQVPHHCSNLAKENSCPNDAKCAWDEFRSSQVKHIFVG